MKSRAVRSYYHDLNDMIKKYMVIDKVEKRFERRMRRQQSEVGEGAKKAPYSWYGSSDELTSSNWMRDARATSSSSSTSASGARGDLERADAERQLPNRNYYRPHERAGSGSSSSSGKRVSLDERAPLMMGMHGPGGGGPHAVEEATKHRHHHHHHQDVENGEEEDEDDEEAVKRRAAEAEENSWHIKLAIHATFWVNVALFFMKSFASVESLSLSIIASTLDSFLDLLSGSVIFFASWIVNGRSREQKFPGGTSRIEPLAVLIFAVAMFTGTRTHQRAPQSPPSLPSSSLLAFRAPAPL
jgi:hypothetical protein